MKRYFVFACVFAVLMLSAVSALAQTNSGVFSPQAVPLNVQVSHNGVITGASHLVTDFSEVMLAIDPTDPYHLLGSSKFFFDPINYRHYTGVFESYDGGHTWDQLQPSGLEVYTKTSDPVTTFDDVGNGYFTLLTIGPLGVDMLKKPVGGASAWGAPVVVEPEAAAGVSATATVSSAACEGQNT